MGRLLIAVLGSLLAVALIAPAAQGAAKVQHLTLDGELAGGPPGPQQGIVELNIDYLVKHRNGHKRLIPNQVTSFLYSGVPVSCDQGNSLAGWNFGGFGAAPGVKISKKRFSYKYTATDPYGIGSTFQFAGQKMWQERTKWWRGDIPKPPGKKFFWKRASGTLNIIDWGWPARGATNCTTNGARSWSAHQCFGRRTDPVYLPNCFNDF